MRTSIGKRNTFEDRLVCSQGAFIFGKYCHYLNNPRLNLAWMETVQIPEISPLRLRRLFAAHLDTPGEWASGA